MSLSIIIDKLSVIFLLSFVFIIVGQKANDLEVVVNRLSMVSRLINGIAIQQNFENKKLKPLDVAAEMIGVDVDSLQSLTKIQTKSVETKLSSISKSVKKVELTTSKEVESTTSVLSKLENMKKDFVILTKASTFNSSLKLKNDFEEAASFQYYFDFVKTKLVREVYEKLDFLQKELYPSNVTMMNQVSGNLKFIKTSLSTVKIFLQKFKGYKTDLQFLLVLKNSSEPIKELMRMSIILQSYLIDQNTFISLNTSMSMIKNGISTVSKISGNNENWLSAGKSLDEINKAINSIKLSSKQEWTFGFSSGCIDIEQIYLDMQDKWLKDNIAEGNDFELLRTLLKPLGDFNHKTEKLARKWKEFTENSKGDFENISSLLTNSGANANEARNTDSIETSIDNIKSCSNNLTSIIMTRSDFEKIFEEFKILHDFYIQVDEKVSLFESKIMEILELNAMKQENFLIFDTMANLLNTLDDNTNNMVELVKKMSELDGFNDLFTSLKEISDKMEPFSDDNLKNFMINQTLNWNVINAIVKNFNKTGLLIALKCLQNATYNSADIEKTLKFGKDIIKVKEKETYIYSIVSKLSALASIQNAITNLMEPSMTKSRKKRATSVQNSLNMKNAKQMSRDVGKGVNLLKQMSEVFTIDLNKLIDTKEVDTAIKTIPSAGSIWTDEKKNEMKEAMKSLSNLNSFSKQLENENLENSWKMFKESQEVTGVSVDSTLFGSVIAENLRNISQLEVQKYADSFEKLSHLQLDFVRHHSDLKTAFLTYSSLRQFFDDFFQIKRPLQGSEKPSKNDTLSKYLIFGIGGVFLLSITIVVAIFTGVRIIAELDKKKNPDKYWAHVGLLQTIEGETNRTSITLAVQHGEIDLVNELIKKGSYIDEYRQGFTALHLAVDYYHPEIVKTLIKNGADRSLISDKLTAEQLLKNKIENEKSIDENMKQLKKIEKIFDDLKDRNFSKRIPDLLPAKKYVIDVSRSNSENSEKFEKLFSHQISKAYPSPWEPGDKKPVTHIVVNVDENGIYDADESGECSIDTFDNRMLMALAPVFSRTILVKSSWIDDCIRSKKIVRNDYEHRVTKVKFNNNIYETVDSWKKSVHRRDIGFLFGTWIQFIGSRDVDVPPFNDIVAAAKGKIDDHVVAKSVSTIEKPYFHPNMKSRILIYGHKREDMVIQKMYVPNTDKIDEYTVSSILNFLVFLLAKKNDSNIEKM